MTLAFQTRGADWRLIVVSYQIQIEQYSNASEIRPPLNHPSTMSISTSLSVPTLRTMRGDSEAMCIDWFPAYAASLPPPFDAQARAIGDQLFADHKRGTLRTLFKVLSSEVERSIKACIPVTDDPVGWRQAIQDEADFVFAEAKVPSSAALAKLVAPDSHEVQTTLSKMEARVKTGTGTISDDLAVAGGSLPNSPIKEACFSVFSNNVSSNVALEHEVRAFTDKVIGQVAADYGKLNIGAPLLRKMSKQAHRRVPHLPTRGKVQGNMRSFETMIGGKTLNRDYVRCSTTLQPVRPRAPACTRNPVCGPDLHSLPFARSMPASM